MIFIEKFRAPDVEPNVCCVDIECVKVDAPKGWPAKKRFKTFMVGIGTRGQIHVARSDDEAELIRWTSMVLKPVCYYAGTREFDRMVLEARWVHARAAHSRISGPWPRIPPTHEWVRLRDPVRSSRRDEDIFWKKSIEMLKWPKLDPKAVTFHCMLDVLELMMTLEARP